MAKQIHNRVSLADFETKAQELIGLTFDLCEHELREHRRHRTETPAPKRKALQFAALSVQDSIKAFLAIVQINCGSRKRA
jgi:hypothetical protein